MIAAALAGLSQESNLTIDLSGQETFAGTTVRTSARIWVHYSTVGLINSMQVEMLINRNGRLTQRTVGDGNRMWNYDVYSNTYSVFYYGDSTFDTAFASTVLKGLTKHAFGQVGVLPTLLKQINEVRMGGTMTLAAKWLPWIPTANVVVPVPINIVNFPTVECYATTPVKSKVVYSLSYPQPGTPVLQSSTYDSTMMQNGQQKVTSWTVTPTNSLLSGSDFTFNRGNAQAISISMPQNGGG